MGCFQSMGTGGEVSDSGEGVACWPNGLEWLAVIYKVTLKVCEYVCEYV